MSNINIEFTRLECERLLEELQFATRFCNRDRRIPLLLWEKIAAVYYEQKIQLYSDDFRNECLGIAKKKEDVEDNIPAKKSFWDFLKRK